MKGVQIVNPDTSIKAQNGWCLWFTQEVYHVPHYYRSAWIAWGAAVLKHYDRDMPSVSVPVFFEHWGTYGTPPTYDNWGHVVAWIPERSKFLSVIGLGYGQQWFNTIEEIERYFKAKFVGWSEDLSGVIIVDLEEGEEKMTRDGIIAAVRAILHREPNEDLIRNLSGYDNYAKMCDALRSEKEWQLLDDRIKADAGGIVDRASVLKYLETKLG